MKKVVVIGGGIAGAAAIKELKKRGKGAVDITLVEPKEYSELPFGILRAFVAPQAIKRPIRKRLEPWLGVKQVRSRVTKLSDESVELENGERIEFDAAIVATGSAVRGFDWLKRSDEHSEAEREEQLVEAGVRLKAANSIAIVGGGPIGVELAGELVTNFPEKKLTVYQGADRLLPALSEGAGKKAYEFLSSRGAAIRLGEKIDIDAAIQGKLVLHDGSAAEADLIYVAVGVEPRTSFAGESLVTTVDDRGYFKVDPTLQITGHPTLFAVGDINNTPEIKLGALAGRQGPVAAQNIIRLFSGKSLKAYRPTKGAIGFVTLGAKAGVAQLPFGRADFMVRMKQKDFFASRMLK